jgi:cell division protein FtsA
LKITDRVVGLDVGTTKICFIVAQVEDNGSLSIIGLGSAPSDGMVKGMVNDIDKAAVAISAARAKAEAMCGFKIDSAVVGLTGNHIISRNNRGMVAVTGQDKEITEDDVERALTSARAVDLTSDMEILHAIPRSYVIDGQEGVHDPVGMHGSLLEVEAHVVTGSSAAIRNLIKSVERAGIAIDDIVLEPIASCEAVLNEDERELGVILADIGGGTTDLAIFMDGSIYYSSVIPVGGNHVTHDIAVGLSTPVGEAERIKLSRGRVGRENREEDEHIPVASISGESDRHLPSGMLSDIIEARIREMLDLIGREVAGAGCRDILPGGIVFTGGGSQIKGLVAMAESYLGVPARTGRPYGLNGLIDLVSNPVYSTGVGLVCYGAGHGLTGTVERDDNPLQSFVTWLRNWLSDIIPRYRES